MVRILFQGDPPVMDFTLIKLNGGQNLVDNQSGEMYSLGSGELTKSVTDAGQALLRSIEATLKQMEPNQSIRALIMLHSHTGFAFIPPKGYNYPPSFAEKFQFVMGGGGEQDSNVIHAQPKNANSKNLEEVKTIVVVPGREGIITQETLSPGIKHATLRDNEDDINDDGGNIITSK